MIAIGGALVDRAAVDIKWLPQSYSDVPPSSGASAARVIYRKAFSQWKKKKLQVSLGIQSIADLSVSAIHFGCR